MPPLDKLALPFTTRDMLSFEGGQVFDLEIVTTTASTQNILVTGATKDAPFRYRIDPTGNIDQESHLRGIGDIPIFLSVEDPSLNLNHGDNWIDVYLRVNRSRLVKLTSGYVSGQRALTWPAPNGNNPWQEPPPPFAFVSNNPAAGANQSDSVGSSAHWIVDAYCFRLVTDANAANRRVHLRILDVGSVIMFDIASNTVQTATQTVDYVFAPFGSIPLELADGVQHIPIPAGLVVPASTSIGTSITSIQATDQISNTRIVRRFMAMDR